MDRVGTVLVKVQLQSDDNAFHSGFPIKHDCAVSLGVEPVMLYATCYHFHTLVTVGHCHLATNRLLFH